MSCGYGPLCAMSLEMTLARAPYARFVTVTLSPGLDQGRGDVRQCAKVLASSRKFWENGPGKFEAFVARYLADAKRQKCSTSPTPAAPPRVSSGRSRGSISCPCSPASAADPLRRRSDATWTKSSPPSWRLCDEGNDRLDPIRSRGFQQHDQGAGARGLPGVGFQIQRPRSIQSSKAARTASSCSRVD